MQRNGSQGERGLSQRLMMKLCRDVRSAMSGGPSAVFTESRRVGLWLEKMDGLMQQPVDQDG